MSEEKQAGNVITSENAAEFYSQKMGLADQAPTEAEVENPPSEPEQVAEQSEPEAKDEAKPVEERKQNPKLEKRFSEITKQREQARQEAAQAKAEKEALEAELRALKQQAQPAPQPAAPVDAKPQPSQFRDAFEYAEALAEWSSEQALIKRDREEADRRADQERQKVISTWANKVAAAKSEIPDFDDMVASSDVVVPDHIRDAMLESDVGPRILYALAEDADLAKKLTSMSVAASLREIGKLEAKFEKQPETKPSNTVGQSKAPPPINPIKAGTSTEVQLIADGKFHGTYAQWKASRKAGKIR